MHPNIIFAKFQYMPTLYPDVETRERKKQAYREDVMRWGVIPMQFDFIIIVWSYIQMTVYR